ncbi:hypothetical protein HY604_04760 [Candidatus Peregrinibacteria bacterium]|nr:hypothetical protein [Candidatus Peregrinibacteria bacterium]
MELKMLEEKQMRLLNAYLEQTITNEEYTETKKKLLNRKIEIKENLKESGGRGLHWLELPHHRPKSRRGIGFSVGRRVRKIAIYCLELLVPRS